MKKIKVLGTGCASCVATYTRIEQRAADRGVEVRLSKVEDIQDIMAYGVMSTPAVVIDGQVVHAGGVPKDAKIDSWLSEAGAT